MARSSGPVYCCVNPGSKEGGAGGIPCTMPCCTTPGESGESRTKTGRILDTARVEPSGFHHEPFACPAQASGPAIPGDPDVQRGSRDRPAPRCGRQLRPHLVVRGRTGSGERRQLGSDSRASGGMGCCRPSRPRAAPFPEFRAPDRRYCRTGSRDRRCGGASGCRFARPSVRDSPNDRSLLRRLRRGVRAERIARRGIRL